MKSFWFFPAGLVIGAAIMWVFLSGRNADPNGTPTTNGTPPERVPEDPVPAPPAVPGPEPDDPAVPIPPDPGAEGLTGAQAAKYHLAQATLYAIRGNLEEFLLSVGRAFETEAGASAEQVQEIVTLLPAEERPEALEALVERFPGSGWDISGLSELYREAGNVSKAFDIMATRLSGMLDSSDLGEIASELIALDAERAADVLERAAAEHEWGSAYYVAIAARFANAGKNPLALPFLRRAVELEPGNGEAIDLLATVDPAAAEPLARTAALEEPESPHGWARLAKVLGLNGDQQGSFEAYAKALKLEDDEDVRREWLRAILRADTPGALPVIKEFAKTGDDETLGVLGRAYALNGRSADAFETFLRAHNMDQEDSEWLHRMVDVDPDRAARHFHDKIQQYPGGAGDELIGSYATALMALGDEKKAFDRYEQALRLDSSDWEWLRGIAKSDPIRAIPILEKRADAEPDVTVTGALGDAYARLGRTVDAIRQYEKAIEMGEDRGRWMAALAQVDEGRGIAMLRSAIDSSPGDDEMWGALGDAYREMGRIGEARIAYDKALQLDPADWEWNRRRDNLR